MYIHGKLGRTAKKAELINANDINGNKIYHHDIVTVAGCKRLLEVVYNNNIASYALKHIELDMESEIETFDGYQLVVVGNKYIQNI